MLLTRFHSLLTFFLSSQCYFSACSPETLKELEFSPVKLTGKFHHDRELYLSFRWGKLPTGTSQEVGYHVLTPLERPNGYSILFALFLSSFRTFDSKIGNESLLVSKVIIILEKRS